jgi:hypothetical protein
VSTALIARIGIAIVLAAALAAQARKLSGQPHRRRAFYLGAAALGCFAAFNATLAVAASASTVQAVLAFGGVALFVGAAISLALSLTSGERAGDRGRIVAQAQAFRAEREADLADKRDQGE